MSGPCWEPFILFDLRKVSGRERCPHFASMLLTITSKAARRTKRQPIKMLVAVGDQVISYAPFGCRTRRRLGNPGQVPCGIVGFDNPVNEPQPNLGVGKLSARLASEITQIVQFNSRIG